MGGETLVQVAQRGGRWPIPGNIQGQVGQGSEQPALVGEGTHRGPFQALTFCDSVR